MQIGGSHALAADQRQSQIVTESSESQAPDRRLGALCEVEFAVGG
jgi:hypothetical protein